MGKFTNILEGAVIVDIEIDNGGFDYFGYIRKGGDYIIVKTTTSTSASTRYALGTGKAGDLYTTAWSARTTKKYTLPIIRGN